MRPTPVTDATAPLTGWFWALPNDHQIALILGVAAFVGVIIWTTRALRHAGDVIDNAPREIRTSWAPEIEAQCKPWTEADDAALADYLSDMPYDQEADQ